MKLVLHLLLVMVAVSSQLCVAGDAKELRSHLIGTWVINAEKTLALPIDKDAPQGLSEDREKRVSIPVSWEYREDGTATHRYNGREYLHRFYVMEQSDGTLWIILGQGYDSTMFRTARKENGLVIDPIAIDSQGHEVSMSGPLFIEKQAEQAGGHQAPKRPESE